MRTVDLIVKKRDGYELTRDEIKFMIDGVVSGEIPDYQTSAWLMAVCFRDMTDAETGYLTECMTYSGEVMDLSSIKGVKVDKHSTGGVGDTTTLIVAPLVAACGGVVAKMSGRGLGHTGGTIDKLESVPGISVDQSEESFLKIVRETGLCVTGQTKNLVPADKLLYALRDVTGTVESIPLIASSIMSKKIAAGADRIVLDVKLGSGAFMKDIDSARRLARTMVEIGRHMGRKTVAIITDMDQPLGLAIGNGLEMKDAIDALSGKLPYDDPLMEVSLLLAAKMLILGGNAKDEAEAEAMLKAAIDSGAGLAKLEAMLSRLGGDTACIRDSSLLCKVAKKTEVKAQRTGYIANTVANEIGRAAQLLGAGRATKADRIDPAVGLVMHKRRGDYVSEGESLATLYINDAKNEREAVRMLTNAVTIADEPPKNAPIIYEVVE